MSRPTFFAKWLGTQAWSMPESIVARYLAEAECAANGVLATLAGVEIKLDGQPHPLPNSKGKHDHKQFYIADVRKHPDQTYWPEITFGTHKASIDNVFWCPRDLAWREFENRSNDEIPDDSYSHYRARAVEVAKEAERQRKAAELLTTEAHAAATDAAHMVLGAARDFAQGENHPYLERRGLAPCPGVKLATSAVKARLYSARFAEWGNESRASEEGDLIIPMYEAKHGGQLIGVQRIGMVGQNEGQFTKLFLSGGKKKGAYFHIPGSDDLIVVAEGFATGLSVAMAIGCRVLVAFDCGNLRDVVHFAKGEANGRPVIVAADNDWETFEKTGKNPGLDAAKAIQEDDGLRVPYLLPQFDLDDSGLSDWDDVRQRDGFDVFAAQIRKALIQTLRKWAIVKGNDGAKIAPDLLRSGMCQSPVSSNDSLAQDDDDVTIETPKLAPIQLVENVQPAHWESLDLSERLYAENFPDLSDKGSPLDTLENLAFLMECYGIHCRYNRVSKDAEIKIPGVEFSRDNYANATLAALTSLCKRSQLPVGSLDMYDTAIADQKAYNPVLDWIQSSPWDGIDRIQQLTGTIKTPQTYDNAFKNVLITKWLISAIAAIANPKGFYSKGVLVFRGGQSKGKTTWFKRLVDDTMTAYVKDGMHIDPKNKDTVFTATSHWLVELGELDATFRKSDIASLKAFITQSEDRIRRPFDRKDSILPRRTVFFASVNDREFLVDDTGNTRWWTIEVEEIDFQHRIDMQQLWAQVYESLYLGGMEWWLTQEQEAALNISNAEFEQSDPMEEMLISKFEFNVTYDELGKRGYSYKEKDLSLAIEILMAMGYREPDKRQRLAIGKTLERMGVVSKRTARGKVYGMPVLRPTEGGWR